MKNLLNRKVYIKEGMYKGEWGIIKLIEGDIYHVGIANGNDLVVFDRNELRVIRESK